MVVSVGIEPTTPRFSVLCSANWAMKPKWRFRRELNPRSLAWQASVITATPRNHWLRELDLNQRPQGYEPYELPGCSIPRYYLNGGGKGIRTPAPVSRPPGFQDRSLQPDLGIPPKNMVPRAGLEPARALTPEGF